MIDVVMTCYFPDDVPERQQYAKDSLRSLIDGLRATSDSLRLVVADDSEHETDTALWLLNTASKAWKNEAIYSRAYHMGIGVSLNRALSRVNDQWLYTTDDWVLTDYLSLDNPSQLLRLGYDLVRLGPVHPDLQCITRFQAGLGWWLDLRQEYGGFAFATRPFLATKAFYGKVGPFDGELNSYETERLYAERVAESTAKLAYWGGVDLAGPWSHVGLVEVGYRDV